MATERRQGYGRALLMTLLGNLGERGIEAVGFCEKPVRGFYEKCGLPILRDGAKHLREYSNGQWLVPADDDILNLTLSESHWQLLGGLNDQCPAYLVE